MEVLGRRLGPRAGHAGPAAWERVLDELRILIIHAGGDSRRMPAFGPDCSKICDHDHHGHQDDFVKSLCDREKDVNR